MDKSVVKNLIRKRLWPCLPLIQSRHKRPHGTKRWLKKENADLLATPILDTRKKLIQSNLLNTETEGAGKVGALELSALTGLGS